MAWIESHQSLGGHLKLRRLARELRIHRAQAIGHLHFLWWWALDNAPTGDLSALASAEIADVAEWPGPEDTFVAALKACGWIDGDGKIHEWEDYAGRILVQRAKDRERKRAERARMLGGQIEEVRQTSGGRPEDIQPESAQARPPNARVRRPTLDEVLTEASLRGVTQDAAQAFWEHYEASGWIDGNSNPIANWRPKLGRWAANERQRRTEARALRRGAGGEALEIRENIQVREI